MGLLDRWTKKTQDAQLKQKEIAPEAAVPEAKAVAPNAAATAPVSAASASFRIIIRPLVTEKAAHAESSGKYTFVVANWASKHHVKQAVKELYGVEPMNVNIIGVQGKWMRFGKSFGRRSDFKKAVVTIPAGKTITIHEGV